MFELWFSQGICPVVGHMVVLFSAFLRKYHTVIDLAAATAAYCNHKHFHKRETRGSVVKKNVLVEAEVIMMQTQPEECR